jgi:hypothetical protein
MTAAHSIEEWLSEVDDIALSSTVAAPDAQGRYVRAMGMLMQLCPDSQMGTGMCRSRQAEVMQNVRMGAFETAALRLVPADARIMTSTPGEGHFLATVRLDGQRDESTSSGSTFALAVVSALALSLVDHYHELAGSLPG